MVFEAALGAFARVEGWLSIPGARFITDKMEVKRPESFWEFLRVFERFFGREKNRRVHYQRVRT